VRGRLDAVLTAARVAPLTRNIGLVPAVTVTHTEPFHISKAIATLDYVSTGRAGLRVQVSARRDEAAHFGRRRFPSVRPGDPGDPAATRLVSDLLGEAADYVEVIRRLCAAAIPLPVYLSRRHRGPCHPRRGRPGAGVDPRQQRRESAQAAGRNGLRFAANYHVSPATVLEAVDGYPAAFSPSAELPRPYISVSADVVVADDEATARDLASGYGLWVHSIRCGAGAILFPAPEQARAHRWSPEERALVADRVDTQFVGSPRQVTRQLEQLRDATDADELIITTITHRHADRVRSYQLLAEEWRRR
jgi:alkanesulfonate monooxygenase SsuD/methylene tetrahydromethanopterin reductase-like flavin-dependent oxidoreductase (luciferase family)